MILYLVRRVGQLIVTLFAVTFIVFMSSRLSGNPAALMLGPQATPAQLVALEKQMGLNYPLLDQYWHYISGVVTRGNLGNSVYEGVPVIQLIGQRVGATLELAAVAFLMIVVIGLALGLIAGVTRGSKLDTGIVGLLSMLQAMPVFWAGQLLILIFAVALRWLPASGRGGFSSVLLPALTLALISIAQLARILRSEVSDALASRFVLAAEGRGLGRPRVVLRHAMRVAGIPALTVMGIQFGGLMGGAVITETIFAWPGVGQLTLQALQRRDYPVIIGCIIFLAAAFIIVNFIVDILYTVLDPRARLVAREG